MVKDGKRFEEIPFIKDPEFPVENEECEETLEMTGFAYILGEDGKPVVPEGMIELFKQELN